MSVSTWKIHEIRKQVAVIDGKLAPSMVLKNARLLQSVLKKWIVANIWILGNRIVYVGNELPLDLSKTEVIDLEHKVVVPGYIEPHVHPTQLYNPHSFADYAAQSGTTTFIADNMTLALSMSIQKAFTFMDQLKKLPFSFYWWARFDAQTELQNEDEIFTNKAVLEWLGREDVLLGGELTGWPRLIRGDDLMLNWIQEAKNKAKKVEGHFPGASEKTLARMKLFGADSDHEAMTVEEVERRILNGLDVTLRHSSIRPDLPQLLKGILEKELDIFDHLMMTTDGSTPAFHEDGVMDKCIRIALEAGVSPVDAYNMASYNIARYYNKTHLHGLIATGRFATLNILKNELTPNPESVLSKGIWLKRDGKKANVLPKINWNQFETFKIPFDISDDDFQFSMPIGIQLTNEVITKPYSINLQFSKKELPLGSDESYLMLIDRKGKWRVNTMIKGFDTHLKGFASSYSSTGEIILIGKSIEDMKFAFNELKRINGGIVLTENKEVVASIPLKINGKLFDGDVEQLIQYEKQLSQALNDRGYSHSDAIYTLFFLQSTHLPYIRITPQGIYDVMKKKVMLPAVIR